MKRFSRLPWVLLVILPACDPGHPVHTVRLSPRSVQPGPEAPSKRDYRVIHVYVALCDNKNQGIVPVAAHLGNGQDPVGNLYWGARYGVNTFFSKSPHWSRHASLRHPEPSQILERCVFRLRDAAPSVYVVADAYDGSAMDNALTDFFSSAAGLTPTSIEIKNNEDTLTLQAGGQADLICFVGHNGLMDRPMAFPAAGKDHLRPSASVVLACKSRDYFSEPLRRAHCPPLITTTGLMAPEAYVLDATLRSWAAGELPETVRRKAAQAYAKYQRINEAAAERLFAAR